MFYVHETYRFIHIFVHYKIAEYLEFCTKALHSMLQNVSLVNQISVRVLVHTLLTGHNFHENLHKICKLI